MQKFNAEEVLADFKNWHLTLKKYQVPSYRKAVVQITNSFGFFVVLWALQFYLFDVSVWFVVLLALLNGLILGRIFIIQHDCGHRSFTRNQTVNTIIGATCSIVTFIPFKYWAKNHDYHHAHNGQLETSDIGDVHCMTTEEYAQLSLVKKIYYRVYRSPFYLFTVGGFVYVVLYNRFALMRKDGFTKVKWNVLASNITFFVLYALLGYVLGFKKFFAVQFINLFFFGIYALWFFYIQHQYEHIYKSGKEKWNYVLSAVKGSTYYNLPYVGHWLTGNIGYHHIHHLCPTIPNYNLRKAHKENPVFEKHVNKLSFWQSLKTVNANLWDEKLQKMVSFSEYKRNRRLAKAA